MWTPKQISSFIDLTSLNAFDSSDLIASFLEETIAYEKQGFQVVAVCFYPNFARQSSEFLKNTEIKTAVVSGSFPSSQSFLSIRLNECEMALEAGADEIDIVLNLGAFDAGNHEQVVEEIKAFKGLMPEKSLKVILETGYLQTKERIQKAAQLAIQGGADFIKTSTGKDFPGATLEAAEVMAQVIKQHQNTTGKRIGLKISGGVRTKEDAEAYLKLVRDILGESYLRPDHFRIGASSLMKNLIQYTD